MAEWKQTHKSAAADRKFIASLNYYSVISKIQRMTKKENLKMGLKQFSTIQLN